MRPAHIRNTCILVCAVLSVAACSTTKVGAQASYGDIAAVERQFG